MKFSETDRSAGHLIEGYGADGIVIDGRPLRPGLAVTPQRVVQSWGPSSADLLTAEHIDDLIALEPQIIVLGTGARQIFPDPAIYARAMEQRIGVEVMDTGAACRTYNILMAEGRRVVAAFIP